MSDNEHEEKTMSTTPNPWNYGTPAPTPEEPLIPSAKPTRLGRTRFLLAAGAIGAITLVIGVLIGASLGSKPPAAAEPAPTVTVTTEVPAPVDAGCAVVAEELMDMLALSTSDVMIEQNDIMIELVEALTTYDYDKINELAGRVDGVSATVDGLTQRLAEVQPEYERCVNP